MRSIIKTTASYRRKIAGFLLFSLSALFVYALLSNTLINDELYYSLCIYSLVPSFLFAALFFTTIIDPNNNHLGPPQYRGKFRWIHFTLAPLLLFGISVLAIAKGAPALIHWFIAEDTKIVLTVDSKSSLYRSRWCNGRIRIKGRKYMFNNHLCGMREADWLKIKEGLPIQLNGKKSVVGFSFDFSEK